MRALDVYLRVPFIGWIIGSWVLPQGFVHETFTRLDVVVVNEFTAVEMGQMFIDKVGVGLSVVVSLSAGGQANCSVGFGVRWWWVGNFSEIRGRFVLGWWSVGGSRVWL